MRRLPAVVRAPLRLFHAIPSHLISSHLIEMFCFRKRRSCFTRNTLYSTVGLEFFVLGLVLYKTIVVLIFFYLGPCFIQYRSNIFVFVYVKVLVGTKFHILTHIRV